MFTHNGMSVSSWVILDGSCQVEMELSGDNAQFEFGPNRGDFGLVLDEKMIDLMTELLAKAKQHFEELDREQATAGAATGGEAHDVAAGIPGRNPAARV